MCGGYLCNNRSLKSPYHQTINLQIAQGVPVSTMVLNWTQYSDESGSYIPSKYYIYRGITPDNLQLLDSISGSQTMYNDLNVFDVYYYRLAIVKPENCEGSKTNYTISFSNRKDNSPLVNVNETASNDNLKIYPNPATTELIIETLQNIKTRGMTCEIWNTEGQIIRNIKLKNHKTKIDISELNSGFYTIKVKSDNGITIKKIVIQ